MSATIPLNTSPFVSNLQLSSYDDLIKRSVSVAQSVCPDLTDFSSGSPSLALMSVKAYSDLWLQWLVYNTFLNSRFFTTTGGGVDTWANDFGFSRSGATYANGFVTFTRFSATNQLVIPVGVICQTGDGTQKFITLPDIDNVYFDITTQRYLVPPGQLSVSILVQAVNPGIGGNVVPGAISLMYSSVTGVNKVNNPLAMAGGVDGEGDSSFKSRFVPYFNSRSSGTSSAIVNAILSIGSNLTYQVLENANGTKLDPLNNNVTIPNTQFGFFTVYIDSGSQSITSADTVLQVQNAINLVRPLSVDFWVTTPTLVPIDIEYLVNYQPGYNVANVRAIINSKITNYVNTIQPGAHLNYYTLASLINDTLGCKNVQFLIVAGVESNVGVAPGSIIKLGNLAGV
jgi:hypothetical protein